jgi:hypothetical protein
MFDLSRGDEGRTGMQPHDLILKREGNEYLLYEYNGTSVLTQVDGPWTDEATAQREAVAKWTAHGDVYFETAPNVYRVISG